MIVDMSFMNSVTGSSLVAKCPNILQDKQQLFWPSRQHSGRTLGSKSYDTRFEYCAGTGRVEMEKKACQASLMVHPVSLSLSLVKWSYVVGVKQGWNVFFLSEAKPSLYLHLDQHELMQSREAIQNYGYDHRQTSVSKTKPVLSFQL
jgi:hypothetical protein